MGPSRLNNSISSKPLYIHVTMTRLVFVWVETSIVIGVSLFISMGVGAAAPVKGKKMWQIRMK